MNLDHQHQTPQPVEDAGTQALSEALKSSFTLVKVAMALLVVYFCCSNFFIVKQNERAILLHFGQPTGRGDAAVLGPGIHAAWPYPIDEVKRISAAQILSANSTLGWYAESKLVAPANLPPPPTLNPIQDGYLLTGDGNIFHLKATLRYRVDDPVQFEFGFTNASVLVTNDLNNALFFAAAQFTVDDAMRRNLVGLQERVARRVEQLAREQKLGISVVQVDLVPSAPRQVKAAFEEVTAAENELSSKVNEAQAYANGVLARASGEASGRTNIAESDRNRLVSDVEAEAQYFTVRLPEYERDPALFARRLQVEYLSRVLTNAQDKWVMPDRVDQLRLQLSREAPRLKAPVEAPKTSEHVD